MSLTIRHLLAFFLQYGVFGLVLLAVADDSFLFLPIGSDLRSRMKSGIGSGPHRAGATLRAPLLMARAAAVATLEGEPAMTRSSGAL